MKTSEVLERALQLFGSSGENWVRRSPQSDRENCSVTAIDRVGYFPATNAAFDVLRRSIGQIELSAWNDRAADFSEIRAGFLKAIELARKQEQANDN